MKKGYLYAIISAVLFGTAGLFVKLAHKTGLDSITLLTVQYVLAVTLMFIIGILFNRKSLKVSKSELKNLAILGVLGNTFMTVFYYKAFEYLPVAMVTMLLYTYPIIVFLYTFIFGGEKFNYKKAIAVFIAFVGGVFSLNILTGKFEYSLKGVVFGLLCAVFYAFMNIYSEKKLEKVNALAINAYSTLFSLVALCLYKFPIILVQGTLDKEKFFYIGILAIFCEIMPLTLLYSSIKHIGSLKVSVIGNLEIPTAMIMAYLILNEKITLLQIIGAILIVYAIYLIRKK